MFLSLNGWLRAESPRQMQFHQRAEGALPGVSR